MVKVAPHGSREVQISTFDDVDESTLYCLEKFPVDEDCLQRHIRKQKLEFGKACEVLVLKDFPGFQVVRGTTPKKSKAPPANPYPYRLDQDVEVDFYAKKGSEAIAGTFQLTLPEQGKIDAFFNHCKKLNPPATSFIFGVSLANPVALEQLRKKFAAVLVRSASGFRRL